MNEKNNNQKKSPLKGIIMVLITIFLLLGIPRLSGLIADQFNYQSVDPDGAFAWISVHHIVQMLIFFLIIILLMKTKGMDFRLTKGDTAEGIKYVKKFTLYFFIYNLIAYAIIYFTGGFQPFQYPLNLLNVTGYLGFQLLLSGPSEELIFRAFAMTIFAIYISGKIKQSQISNPNLLAAIVFALAHVGISFVPFSLTYNPMQLLLSFGLGLVYGHCYERTNSVYYPMALHSISNVIMVSTTIVLTILLF